MFYLQKTFDVACSHKLGLDYDSKCQDLHGHNFRITVYCKAKKLNKNGMVVDFNALKEIVHSELDHKHLNYLFPFNPTSEELARWIWGKIPLAYRVDVEENNNNIATYEEGEQP